MKSAFSTGAAAPGAAGSAAPFVAPSVEEVARLFPQLEIVGFIGQGGMGAVYKARQPALDRLVALKILARGVAGDAGFAERFHREARALARLNHPNIVAVHDFGEAGGRPYLIMELVDGANLRQVEAAGRLTPEQALAIVPQICDALQFAHNEGVVHRDIKPENILLDKKGRVKITDFGIARILGHRADGAALTGARDVVGTPHYMAPEQIAQPQTVDHRADIYSLGVVFYEMLTGQLPVGKFAPPSRKVQIDVRLDEVVLRALEQEPALRYQQASQVRTAVETIATTAAPPPAGKAPGVAEATFRVRRFRPRFWHVLLGGLAVVFLGPCLLGLLAWSSGVGPGGSFGVWAFAVFCGLLGVITAGLGWGAYWLAKRGWLVAVLALVVMVLLLWLSAVLALQTELLAGLALLAAAVALFVFAVKKSGLPSGVVASFTIAFMVVLGAATLVTFLLPEEFVSTARLELVPTVTSGEGAAATERVLDHYYDPYRIQTELQVIQSQVVLAKVSEALDLPRKWGQRFGNGRALEPGEALGLLMSRISLRPGRNSMLIEIGVYGDDAQEDAAIANKIADVYADFRAPSQQAAPTPGAVQFRIRPLDRAQPAPRPVRPNKPLNVAIGALLGILAGAVVAAAWAGRQAQRASARSA
jgi:predicted Ser/Thr protein kinase